MTVNICAHLVVYFCSFSYHVSRMFENERFFSHLSALERELSFRTEMVSSYFSFEDTCGVFMLKRKDRIIVK